MEHVCSVLQHDTVPPKKYTQSLVCPEGCKMYRMADHDDKEKNSTLKMFNLGQDGRTLSIDSNSTYSKVYLSAVGLLVLIVIIHDTNKIERIH